MDTINNYPYQEPTSSVPSAPECQKGQENDMSAITAAFAVFVAQQIALQIVNRLEDPETRNLFKVREIDS